MDDTGDETQVPLVTLLPLTSLGVLFLRERLIKSFNARTYINYSSIIVG